MVGNALCTVMFTSMLLLIAMNGVLTMVHAVFNVLMDMHVLCTVVQSLCISMLCACLIMLLCMCALLCML